MVLSTATPSGRPSARTVLLRGVTAGGFEFHTNYTSRKGRELAANPFASLLLPWYGLGRQVVIDGRVEKMTPQESDAYWASRPTESQLSALASPQSQVIDSREWLENRRSGLVARHREDAVPRPDHWGGFRVVPDAVEFWQLGPHRMHDRLRYRRHEGGWKSELLAP